MSAVDRVEVSAALERTAYRLLSVRLDEDQEISLPALRARLEELPEVERPAIDRFFTDLASTLPGGAERVRRADVIAFLDARLAAVGEADHDRDFVLTDAELATLDRVGRAAAELARALAAVAPVPAATAHALGELTGEALKAKLREIGRAHVELGYTYARAILFSEIFNERGAVREVYAGTVLATTGIPRGPGAEAVNTEHMWPQSRGVARSPAKSDLHHLFPTDAETNGKRSSFPLGKVAHVEWEKGGSRLGLDEAGRRVFEPPVGQRGAAARALAYVHTMYELPFQPGERETVLAWNAAEPPSDEERERNEDIARHQRNRNPFVDSPELVARALAVAA